MCAVPGPNAGFPLVGGTRPGLAATVIWRQRAGGVWGGLHAASKQTYQANAPGLMMNPARLETSINGDNISLYIEEHFIIYVGGTFHYVKGNIAS